MPADNPPEVVLFPDQIVWPEKEEMEKGLAAVERYAPLWKASPALLVIKPYLGLIVSLENIKHDKRYFSLTIAVEEAIIAPKSFDAQNPITLTCVWNQPYMSLGADSISAPYSFYLHFGAHGVQRVREFSATRFFDTLRNDPMLIGLLRACFQPDFKLPAELSSDDTADGNSQTRARR
jgi:hypothetical protein